MTAPRPALPAELSQIVELLRENGLPTSDLAASRVQWLVDAEDGTIAGVIGLERFGDSGLLRSLAVQASRRGDGRGIGLVDALEAHARAQGIGELVLLTQTAQPFFVARGYRTIAREQAPIAVQGSAEFRSLCPASAVCMARRLQGA
jgi:amino-acid N-acetyltransferase